MCSPPARVRCTTIPVRRAWQHISDEDLERYYLGASRNSRPSRSISWLAGRALKVLKRHRIGRHDSAQGSSQAVLIWSEATLSDVTYCQPKLSEMWWFNWLCTTNK